MPLLAFVRTPLDTPIVSWILLLFFKNNIYNIHIWCLQTKLKLSLITVEAFERPRRLCVYLISWPPVSRYCFCKYFKYTNVDGSVWAGGLLISLYVRPSLCRDYNRTSYKDICLLKLYQGNSILARTQFAVSWKNILRLVFPFCCLSSPIELFDWFNQNLFARLPHCPSSYLGFLLFARQGPYLTVCFRLFTSPQWHERGAVYRGLLFLVSDLMLLALRELTKIVNIPECDIPMVPVPEKIGPKNSTSTRKFVSRKKVPVSEDSREFGTGTREFPGIFHFLPEPVLEKNGPEKKYHNRFRKNLVSGKSIGTVKNSEYSLHFAASIICHHHYDWWSIPNS